MLFSLERAEFDSLITQIGRLEAQRQAASERRNAELIEQLDQQIQTAHAARSHLLARITERLCAAR